MQIICFVAKYKHKYVLCKLSVLTLQTKVSLLLCTYCCEYIDAVFEVVVCSRSISVNY